ncbi:MAG: deoxyribonuclease V, partial [Vicinamibacteria bacterium]
MRIPRPPHSWSVTPAQAIQIQKRLAGRVRQSAPRKLLRFIAGVDLAFSRDGRHSLAGVVLWDVKDALVIEEQVATKPLAFPYVPGLLSFRESPAVLAALRKLRRTPDCVMCDGHGFAHPRRFGLACHVGVLCNVPTIGCAKSLLIGDHREPRSKRGSRADLTDAGDIIGTVLRTRDGLRPVFVSIGHRIDLPTAERVVLDCATRYRLPEPTRRADRLVASLKRS